MIFLFNIGLQTILNLLFGANSSAESHHGHHLLTTATLSLLLKLCRGEECQSLESCMNTDPALDLTCISPDIGAVRVMLSFGPLGVLYLYESQE